METLWEILAEVGAGRGEGGDNVVRFLLPFFFWIALALIAHKQWQRERESRDVYIEIAALVGLCRELFMLIILSSRRCCRCSFSLPPYGSSVG